MINVEEKLKNQRVLVTGATGFTGSVLTKKLVAAGAHVTAIARTSSDISPFDDLPIKWVRGDVFDAGTVTEAMQEVSYVFHTAAAYREAKLTDQTYHDVHVLSTQRLAEAAATLSDFQRFVHVSTVGVHGHIKEPPADETAPFAPGDVYQRTKAEAEQWLHSFAHDHQLDYTVIRPAAIYGPGDKRLLKLFKMALKPVTPVLGYGECLYHFIHVEDLTNAMLAAAFDPAAAGEAFIVGDPEAWPLVKTLHTIAGVVDRRPRIIRLPAGPFFAAGYLCEAICRPLGIEPPIYPRRVAFFTKDRSFNTEKLRHTLNVEYTYTTKTGLEETARWYLDKGWLKT